MENLHIRHLRLLSLLSQEQDEGTVNGPSLWYKYFDRIYFDTINFNSLAVFKLCLFLTKNLCKVIISEVFFKEHNLSLGKHSPSFKITSLCLTKEVQMSAITEHPGLRALFFHL